jgi:hypothetical protein
MVVRPSPAWDNPITAHALTNNCGKYTTDGPQEGIVCLRQTNEKMASPCVCVACYNKQAVSDKQIGGYLQIHGFSTWDEANPRTSSSL